MKSNVNRVTTYTCGTLSMSIHQNHEATLLVQVAAIFVGSTKNIQIDFQAC